MSDQKVYFDYSDELGIQGVGNAWVPTLRIASIRPGTKKYTNIKLKREEVLQAYIELFDMLFEKQDLITLLDYDMFPKVNTFSKPKDRTPYYTLDTAIYNMVNEYKLTIYTTRYIYKFISNKLLIELKKLTGSYSTEVYTI